jgi:hypothetical protein
MKKEQIIIISVLITLITFPFSGLIIEKFLLKFEITNDYGYTGTSYFESIYNLFYDKDGLYDAPNLFFYTFTFIITLLIVYNLLHFSNILSNKK